MEQQQVVAAKQEGLQSEAAVHEAAVATDLAVQWESQDTSGTQQLIGISGGPGESACSSGEGPYGWMMQLQACVAAGTYPRVEVLRKSVEQQQQLTEGYLASTFHGFRMLSSLLH